MRPGETRQSLTERAAASFAELAQSLRERGHDPHALVKMGVRDRDHTFGRRAKNFKGTADLCYAAMRELHREITKDQKDQRWAFWLFVLMAWIVPVGGGFLGNFLREGAVRALD